MIKIVYIHPRAIDSGSVSLISTLFLCNELSKHSHEIILAVPNSKDNRKQKEIVTGILGSMPLFKIINYRKISLFGRFQWINGILGENRIVKHYDAIFYTRSPIVMLLTRLHKKQVIFEAHNNKLHQKSSLLNNFFLNKLKKHVEDQSFLKIVTISKNLSKCFINKGFNSNKIIEYHDAIDAQSYNKVMSREAARELLGIEVERNQKLIVYTGNLGKDREIDNILELARFYKDNLFYVVGGTKNQVNYYNGLINERALSNIIFAGRVPHQKVKYYLFAADVLLMIWSKQVPTINFCSPLKVFEYMAAERIIVGHGFPTIKEVLAHNQEALLANPESFEDLKNQLNRALDFSYPNALSKNARSKVLAKYTWDKRAEYIIHEIFGNNNFKKKNTI